MADKVVVEEEGEKEKVARARGEKSLTSMCPYRAFGRHFFVIVHLCHSFKSVTKF